MIKIKLNFDYIKITILITTIARVIVFWLFYINLCNLILINMIKSEKKTKPSLLRFKLSMFFPFQFFWALNMFCRFWTRILDFQGLESGLVQNSCKRQPFSNYIIIRSEESKSCKRRKHRLLLMIKLILKICCIQHSFTKLI